MLYMQLIGFTLLTISLPVLGGWGHLADGFRVAAVGLGFFWLDSSTP